MPGIGLTVDLEDIDLREMAKYLELPAGKVQELIRSLIKIFQEEWEDLMTSRWFSPPYPTPEEMAVPSIMKKAMQMQALNHLLIDAPIEITWAIIKNATKIARIFLIQDLSGVLDELEKESVKKAVSYGMSVLFQNEIRTSPGVIEFEYKLREGGMGKALIQYIMIYKPSDVKKGEMRVRFYSADPLKPPENRGSWGSAIVLYTELTTDLPPFIVDIRGMVEDYKWVGTPSIEINFPPEVPDLGIRPLSFWEKYVLKPLETTIKEVEIIITKVTGKSLGLTDILDKIKSFLSQFNPFTPAAIVQPSLTPAEVKVIEEIGNLEEEKITQIEAPEVGSQQTPTQAPQPKPPTLEELQEMLDDIAEQIDILAQKVAELVAAQKQKAEKEEIDEEELEELDEEAEIKEKKEICYPNSININTASATELQKITGVGPVLAQRIIEARPFYSLSDLIKVSGIGEKTLQKIISQGCAYAAGYYAGAGTGAGAGPPATQSPSYPKILISEVQIEGGNTNHDFIELYNPNNSNVDISGYKLRKRALTGSEDSIRVLPSGSSIPAKGYYLWASSKDENYPSLIEADASTTQTLAINNSIGLLTPDDIMISALAWGSSTNPFVEGTPFPDNPGKNQSLGRIWDEEAQEYKDTGDNSADFEIQTPTPKAQNQSPIPQPPTLPLAVVINEIAWMGTATSSTDEWIELHNTTKNLVNLSGWKLVSITDGSPDVNLSGSIPPLGFYLLERSTSSATNISEDQIYTGALTNTGEELTLRDTQNNLIDNVSCQKDEAGKCKKWFAGKASPDYVSMERIDPRLSGTDFDNWATNNQITRNGLDANGDPINGTPRAQNSVYQSLPPNPVENFVVDPENSYSNQVALTWPAADDSDTLSEDLSYEIYYLKESLNETNLAQASVASTTATSTLISNLDYNSTYYFGIRAFDGENYSFLATTTPYRTATLATITSGFSADDLNPTNMKNNGRKIARDSSGNGNLYVVYSKNDQIFLAKSEDGGENWAEIPVTPDEELEQINPSIAVDSQDNLHIVWQGKVGTSTLYQIRYRKYDGSFWTDVIENLTADENWSQQIPVNAVDSQNNIHVVWVNQRQTPDRDNRLVSAPQLLYRIFTNQWEPIEEVAEIYKGGFSSFALAIDGQDSLHLISRESRFWDTGREAKIQYRKRTSQEWEETTQLSSDHLQDDFPSLVIDNQNNLHIVWFRLYFNQSLSEIKYLKLTTSSSNIETLDSNESSPQLVIASPSIALDSQGHLYVIWKRWNEKISLKEYSDFWEDVKNLDLCSLNSFAFTNFLWSFYPVNTNQPKTGFALVFYEGTELKFYGSQDLTWE